ncbi:hypothetical protein [Zavarzinella formosa]|uniref:hypothetical protein n=1 Tax=Zavarzinella formosa TaxID=360055 RepID=UPI0004959FD1|nr:hypothetical protein [Zavarzinella formosa]
MISRRTFLSAAGAAVIGTGLSAEEPGKQPRKKLAIVTTEWRYLSHAWHMGERFLAGYPIKGRWHRPAIDVVSAYVDQFPKNDLSRDRARESGFTIYKSVAEALRCGTNKLAVDAVLIIGEHGDYPNNEFGQKKYPRYEFFKQAAEVFKKDGRVAPIFNDKHLSWKWDWAKEMVDTAKEMKIPFLAGSSLPLTWRLPAVEMPLGAEIEEVMSLAHGSVDSYDFHALEVIQCMAERRKGGETGVVALQALRGDSVWKAMETGTWNVGGWDPKLFEACLCRSQTLAQAPTNSHRHPTLNQMREWVKSPVAYRIEYADGLKATMLLVNGLVTDFTFAARLKGEAEPLSTLFYLPPNPNVAYSAALMSKAEELFMTGQAPYPIERTLLTGGLVEAGMQSLGKDQKRLETPHLAIRYQPPKASLFSKE